MKTKKFIRWARRAGSLVTALVLFASFSGQASARILFQDDDLHEIESEALLIDSDGDGVTDDTFIQFGNSSSASDNGVINWNVTTDTFEFDHDVDITGGLAADGDVDFSAADLFRIQEDSDPDGNIACTVLGQLIIDTTSNELQICTTTGSVGNAIWSPVDTPTGSVDFEAVYATDGDNTLTASSTFDIDATGALGFDSDSTVTIGGTVITLTPDAGALELNGDGTNDIDILNAGAAIDIDAATFDFLGTGAFSIDGVGASNVSTTSGNLTLSTITSGTVNLDGATGVNIEGNSSEIDITTTGALDLNSGAFTLNGSTIGITGSGAGTLQFGAASSISTTAGDLTIDSQAGSAIIDGGEAAVDAVRLTASNAAGGIDIDAGSGGITLDTGGAFSIEGAANSDITTTGASDISIIAGDDIIFDDAQLVGIVQLTQSDTDWASALPSVGIIDNINAFTSTSAGEGASIVGLESGSLTNVTPASDDVQAALEALDAVVGSGASNVDEMTFEPEYPNVVIFQDGTSNKGKLEALYDNTNREQHYRWTTKKNASHDIDLRFRYELPADFVDAGDITLRLRTATTTVGDNSIAITVRNDTDDTTCHADAAIDGSSANVWDTVTITGAEIDAGCTAGATLAAGDIIEIQMKLAVDDTNSGITDVGTLVFNYTN